jgi:glycosyltransferase involved in cell wall biosynthesis
MKLPKVSVIIPAYNEEKNIERCLKSVKKQNYSNLEIIVIDDGSTDRTSKIAKNFGVKVIKNKRNLGLAKSLNRGIKASKGSIVITLHADCELVGRNWLSKIIEPFKDAKVAGVTGNPIPYPDKKLSLFDKVNLYFVGAYASTKSEKITNRDLFNNKCDAYRKKYLEEVGFFNEKFKTSGEDIDLTCKLRKRGYKLLIHPKCRIRIHLSSHQNTFVKSLKKRIVYGKVIPYLILNHFPELIRNKTWVMRTVPYISYFILLVMSPFNYWFLFFVFFLNLLLSFKVSKILGINAFLLAVLLIPIYTIIWNIGIIYGIFIINRDRI